MRGIEFSTGCHGCMTLARRRRGLAMRRSARRHKHRPAGQVPWQRAGVWRASWRRPRQDQARSQPTAAAMNGRRRRCHDPNAFDNCIKACNDCAVACSHCASACLREPDPKMMARCIGLAIGCAALCQMAAAAMVRNSELVQAICGLCADACATCGDECSRHEMDHCRACARSCRACATECRKMASLSLNTPSFVSRY